MGSDTSVLEPWLLGSLHKALDLFDPQFPHLQNEMAAIPKVFLRNKLINGEMHGGVGGLCVHTHGSLPLPLVSSACLLFSSSSFSPIQGPRAPRSLSKPVLGTALPLAVS